MLFVIGLFFGSGVGFVVAAGSGAKLSGHDHADPAHHAGLIQAGGQGHAHRTLDISGEAPVPEVDLRLHPDRGDAVNLEILTRNFRFAPEAVNGAHQPGAGHAHVYVDGVRVARAYGPWMHLADVPEGAEIRVTLNANSHEDLTADGAPLHATARRAGR